MDGFLTGYYGYKNLGDEILFFGVINRIFENYQIDKLTVFVGDVDRMKYWMTKNYGCIGNNQKKVDFVSKKGFLEKMKDYKNYDMKFFGGGEVLTDNRDFPYDGYNIFIKNLKEVVSGRFVLMGGIGTPKKFKTKVLYKMLLPMASEIIVRENVSFEIAQRYNKNVALHNDFAYDVVEKFLPEKADSEKRVLININPYIYNLESISKIKDFARKYEGYQIFYVPMDMNEDVKFYDELKLKIPNLQYYNWTSQSIYEIVEFFGKAEAGIGARLHFLLLLHWLGKKIEPLVYQEKINKFFGKKNKDL